MRRVCTSDNMNFISKRDAYINQDYRNGTKRLDVVLERLELRIPEKRFWEKNFDEQ